MTSIVLSNIPQVFDYQHQPIQQQQIVFKKSNIPYVPPEIIRIILGLLKDDRKTLAACALVNHTFNLHVTPFLYHTVSFSYPFTFNSFAKTINGESQRTRLIRHLDLSVLSNIGLQKSDSDSAVHNVVTPDALVKILRHCTMLEAFSISEYSESSINLDVLKVLAFECKNIKILDFCGFSKKQTGLAIMALTEFMGHIKCLTHYDDDGVPTYTFEKIINPSLSHLKRISFHECPIINEFSILTILANSPNLTRLDLGGCSISDLTLNFLATCTNIPENLTHLLLARCKNISSEAMANLVDQCKKLEVLNLYGDRDVATAISEYDLDTILTSPSARNFKSLDIGSSRITSHILYTIQENCTSLTHLGISKASVGFPNLTDLLKALPNLQYIDLTGVNCLNQLNVASIINSLQKDHSLHTIEISEFLSKKLGEVNGWKPLDENHIRRSYYAKQTRPDRVHPRKLDMTETGPERMSKIFQYYSFNV